VFQGVIIDILPKGDVLFPNGVLLFSASPLAVRLDAYSVVTDKIINIKVKENTTSILLFITYLLAQYPF